MIRYTNELYDASKCVRIINYIQANKYMKNGVYPIDIYPGYDNKIVFIFLKESTKDLYERWISHELD